MRLFFTLSFALILSFTSFSQKFVGPDSLHISEWNADLEIYNAPTEKRFFTYDSIGNTTEFSIYEEKDSLDDLIITRKEISSYVGKTRTSLQTYGPDIIGGDTLFLRSVFNAILNDQDLVDSSTTISFNPIGDTTFISSQKRIYENGNYTKLIRYSGPTLPLAQLNQELYSYDAEGNRTERILQRISSVDGNLENSFRELFTFTDSGEVMESTSQDFINGEWVNTRKISYTYNIAQTLMLQELETWDVDSMRWNPRAQITNNINSNNFADTSTQTFYDANLGEFINVFRLYRDLDEFGNVFFLYEENFNGTTNQFEKDLRWQNFFSILSSNKPNFIDDLAVNIFPNPSSDFINIDNKEHLSLSCTLFDSQGALVKRIEQNTSFIQFDINALPKGMYYLNVADWGNSQQQTFKVMKVE